MGWIFKNKKTPKQNDNIIKEKRQTNKQTKKTKKKNVGLAYAGIICLEGQMPHVLDFRI